MKRAILSATARLYDDLGLVGPVILFAKLLIKELWLLNMGWDDSTPQHIVDQNKIVLLTRLVSSVYTIISSRVKIKEVLTFPDSEVALFWALSSPHKFNTYVANRISQIHTHLSPLKVNFYHIAEVQNPANCVSGGLIPTQSSGYALRLEGPSLISVPSEEWLLTKRSPHDNSYLPDDEFPFQKFSTVLIKGLYNTSQDFVHNSVIDLNKRILVRIIYLKTATFVLVLLKDYLNARLYSLLLNRFLLLFAIIQSFWKHLKFKHLYSLRVHIKFKVTSHPVKERVVVFFIVENAPPLQWPIGIITKVMPGRDGVVRVARVRTKSGTYDRPIVKFCPLPTQ
ncbi:uncharacterized protein LOC123873600 [Maniola jurtina]|uniref:uncharacterized protein LOC123873600 n=1 Tax=Maniola jurtina TaxID=191418 RepID=UPI001E688C54|nr:uncharacterized protein LOC123873600 [Maniola jurtina]